MSRGNREMVTRKRYGWGTLYLDMDLARAEGHIRYSVDSPNDWRNTPFSTADARHSKAKAFALVNQWLRGQNPARSRNALPVGRFIKVKAIRRKNGRVDLYRA